MCFTGDRVQLHYWRHRPGAPHRELRELPAHPLPCSQTWLRRTAAPVAGTLAGRSCGCHHRSCVLCCFLSWRSAFPCRWCPPSVSRWATTPPRPRRRPLSARCGTRLAAGWQCCWPSCAGRVVGSFCHGGRLDRGMAPLPCKHALPFFPACLSPSCSPPPCAPAPCPPVMPAADRAGQAVRLLDAGRQWRQRLVLTGSLKPGLMPLLAPGPLLLHPVAV